jgi:GTP-binding protein HflX
LKAIGDRLRKGKVHGTIRLSPGQGRLRALLFEMGAVLKDTPSDDGGWVLELEMEEQGLRRFLKREALPADILKKPQALQPAIA